MSRLQLKTPLSTLVAASLRAGDQVMLSGVIYAARDAAHKRFAAMLDKGEKLPLDLAGQVLYYCGPTPAKPGRAAGSAGPTTSGRMDRYTPRLLETAGLRAMIGKGPRSGEVVDAMKKHGCVYFAALGGGGALIGQTMKSSSIVCFEDLGPEAVYRFEVDNVPLIVAIDSKGNDLYRDGPAEYMKRGVPG
ncbi:MAG: Fe-S-containing hydro-lyase [Chitinispirillaceae bacterium]|nr:Fe-S-containing hydro-lyase [Chitinispirillaceae bacterium]